MAYGVIGLDFHREVFINVYKWPLPKKWGNRTFELDEALTARF